jgi:protein-S-isoprenylcysteine O-methyltransferase Ste14
MWRNEKGEWYVVVQFALMTAIVFAPLFDSTANFHTFGLLSLAGAIVCVLGLGVVIGGWTNLGRNISHLPKPREESILITRGLYSIVRHPMYFGLILAAFGWGVLCNSQLTIIGGFALFLFFDVKARREEKWLESRYSDYAEYKLKVKKLIPFVY